MKKFKFVNIVLAAVLLFAIFSCATTTVTTTVSKKGNNGTAESKAAANTEFALKNKADNSAEDNSESVYKIKELLKNGLNTLYQGSVSEGISQLVSVLAEGSKISNPDDEIKSLIGEAETTLAKIGSSLIMQAGSEWIDRDKNQINASTLDIGTKKAVEPGIILIYNMGTAGNTVVSNAPVSFKFIRGSGLLNGFVNTNNYGKANCSIAKIDNPDGENIIRATLVYRIEGYTYTFENVKRDFVYTPPAKKAAIVVLEKSKTGVSDDPVILDSVYNKLKEVAFDFSQYNGVLLGDKFMKVFGGDPAAIKDLGFEKNISYIVMVLNDCYYTKQIVLNGKKYNIYKSRANATTRIIRVADGKILYSGSVQGISGQGGSREKAVTDVLRKSSRAMAKKIGKDIPEIQSVLSGIQN
ncbi:MAG: hypothetical protein GXP33_02580 [Spirochaetes bacterium]|nr:hypothetical protein [Spirochaetota bacterium]